MLCTVPKVERQTGLIRRTFGTFCYGEHVILNSAK
jgi:hypothetical protein